MKEGTTKDNHNYWQCALIHVNDLSAVGEDAETPLREIGELCALKDDEVKQPDRCLGANIGK